MQLANPCDCEKIIIILRYVDNYIIDEHFAIQAIDHQEARPLPRKAVGTSL